MAFRNSNNCLSRTTRVDRFLIAVVGVLLFALALSPGKAQIVGEIEANIPFPFHAGDTRFPAGKCAIHMLDDSDLSIMEISSTDGAFLTSAKEVIGDDL